MDLLKSKINGFQLQDQKNPAIQDSGRETLAHKLRTNSFVCGKHNEAIRKSANPEE